MNTTNQEATLAPSPSPVAIRSFISTAAHDLREPLRAIRAHMQLLANPSDVQDAHRKEQSVRHIHDGVDRIENLIHDIEEYCLEELREFDEKEIATEAALREARRQVSHQLDDCGAQLTYDPLPVLNGDFDAIAAVFRVLIDNACKFRGAEPPRVSIAAACEGSEWIFSVRDNGQGFSSTYADLIFKPFERLNGKRYPGSGLGLPLAKRIVERHGGRIWVESQPDAGSTFRFALPA